MHVSKRTQAERRATTRAALLEAAARGLSRYGYGNLVLEQVASEAGYTRGALYHQFKGKEDLSLAVVEWVAATWEEEVGGQARREADPADVLIALARGHIVFCRRDIARSIMALRVEFAGRDHPVGSRIETIVGANARRFAEADRRRSPRRLDPAGPAGDRARLRGPRHDRGARDPAGRQDAARRGDRRARHAGPARPPCLICAHPA